MSFYSYSKKTLSDDLYNFSSESKDKYFLPTAIASRCLVSMFFPSFLRISDTYFSGKFHLQSSIHA